MSRSTTLAIKVPAASGYLWSSARSVGQTSNIELEPTGTSRYDAGQQNQGSRGFTLVELLVVVAIIGALIALLAPALMRARREAFRVQCLSNLRSIATASVAYSVDDPRGVLIPVHPTADRNPLHDDGFYDFGGASGAPDAWGGRVGPGSDRAAETRPLNAILGLSGGASADYGAFRCPADRMFDPPVDYPGWVVWEPSLRRRSAFETVGTSYWGNAIKGDRSWSSDGAGPVYSIAVYLRKSTRIPAPADTVLYMEMPALFNLFYAGSQGSPRFASLGLSGWHAFGPTFNLAFCDGRAEAVSLPAGWLDKPWPSSQYQIRHSGVRFDCYPDAPIVDPPVGAGEAGLAGSGDKS